MTVKVGVIGGGGFGRGIALSACRAENDVVLWTRGFHKGEGAPYHTTTDLAALKDRDIIFLAVPSPYMSETSTALGTHLDGRHLLVHVSRGLVGDNLQTLTRVLHSTTPCRRVGALAGPLVADALAKGTPGGGIVGSLFPEVAEMVREAIAGPALKIYGTDDVVGVELASALVGLLALALGYAQGLGIGPSALAVLCSRGIAESQRIGLVLGAREKTFAGLAGFGDLVAAASGDDRPEMKLGRAIARGVNVTDAGREAGAHIEGVTIAERVASYAMRMHIEAPIAATTAAVLAGKMTAQAAVAALMSRQVWVE
jgi:glycerol-3-phosphate dehydrogenase (NAD(P)+)